MINYVMIGTNRFAEATAFYDALLADMGARAFTPPRSSEGDPGPRGEHLYVGYWRDLDGNKFNIICYGQVRAEQASL